MHFLLHCRFAVITSFDIVQKDAAIVQGNQNNAPANQQNQQNVQNVQNAPTQQAASSVYGGGGYGGNVNKPKGAVAPNQPVNDNVPTMPIVALNPYNNSWTIKARITKKSDIRSWQNANGSGTLFSVDLLDDQNSEIKGTFFKAECEKFKDFLQEGQVYRFHGGKVKPIRDRRYSTLNNQYEITFDASTQIVGPIESTTIKTVSYNFKKISEISNIEVGQIIDVVGFVKEYDTEFATITSQKLGGKELFKRDLTLADDSGASIKLTLWGEKAKSQDFDWTNSPIIAAKSVKIGDYNGRSLSILNNSSLTVNPEIPEAFALFNYVKENFGGNVSAMNTNSLSAGGGGGGGERDAYENRRNVSAIKDENLGFNDKPDYSNMKMSVIYYKRETGSSDGPWYTSCPNTEGTACKKKVTEIMGGNGWRCEKCDREFAECKRRYILSTQCGDASGAGWFTLFNEEAEKLLGISADDLYKMKLSSEEAYKRHFDDLLFKEFVATVRSKSEVMPNGDGDSRVKSTVFKYADMDYKDENKKMIDNLKKYLTV